MGTSTSVDQLVGKMTAFAANAPQNSRKSVMAAADVYKTAVVASARRDSGGDGRLSKWGKSGATLNAGYEVKGSGTDVSAILRPRPAGAWRVLEDGARPHLIVPGLTRRQGRALTLFSFLAGQGGSLEDYDIGELASSARGNRNNKNSSRRRKRRKFLAIPGAGSQGEGAAYARHPGTKGKRTWSRGLQVGAKRAPAAAMRAQVDGLTKVFR